MNAGDDIVILMPGTEQRLAVRPAAGGQFALVSAPDEEVIERAAALAADTARELARQAVADAHQFGSSGKGILKVGWEQAYAEHLQAGGAPIEGAGR